MLTKTIKISEKTHESLMQLASKNQTFNDVINFLINYYRENEEFSDEEAEFYNKEIEKFENGNLENVCEVTLEELEQRIIKLENEIKNDIQVA
jgi:predicted CopG family antitoxin